MSKKTTNPFKIESYNDNNNKIIKIIFIDRLLLAIKSTIYMRMKENDRWIKQIQSNVVICHVFSRVFVVLMFKLICVVLQSLTMIIIVKSITYQV